MKYEYHSGYIYYEKIGFGKPIIFLHGWGTSLDTFYRVATAISPKYEVYLIDLPSFGNSKEPDHALDIQDLSTILNDFITDLNLKQPIIVGHSYGGRIGIEYASKFNNIAKLILIDSAGIKRKHLRTFLKTKIYKLRKNYYKITHQLMKYQNLILNSGSSDYQNSSNIQKQMLIKAVNYNQKYLINTITCETLIIYGKNDLITPLKDAYFLHKKIKNSGLVIIPNAGHFPYIENYSYFILVLTNYLEV